MSCVQDSERLSKVLRDTIGLLCKSSLQFSTELRLQGLLGIVIDGASVILVPFGDVFVVGKDGGREVGREVVGVKPMSEKASVPFLRIVGDASNESNVFKTSAHTQTAGTLHDTFRPTDLRESGTTNARLQSISRHSDERPPSSDKIEIVNRSSSEVPELGMMRGTSGSSSLKRFTPIDECLTPRNFGQNASVRSNFSSPSQYLLNRNLSRAGFTNGTVRSCLTYAPRSHLRRGRTGPYCVQRGPLPSIPAQSSVEVDSFQGNVQGSHGELRQRWGLRGVCNGGRGSIRTPGIATT